MYCLDCDSPLDLTSLDNCPNCGSVLESAKCIDCENTYEIGVFNLHLCVGRVSVGDGRSLKSISLSLSKSIDIDEADFELLKTYFGLQDKKAEIEEARKAVLGELLNKFGNQSLLTFKGEMVGKVVSNEWLELDKVALREKFPEIYQTFYTKVKIQNYIKRTSNLI